MTGKLLYAICKELQALPELGLKFIQIARNFDNYNPPQNVLPAAIVGILDNDPQLFIGGLDRREYEVGISVSLLDYNINIARTSMGLVDKYTDNYDVADRIQTLFNRQEFKTENMNTLINENNLITQSRGYNIAHTPYDKQSKNVVTYDIVIRAILTMPRNWSEVPIEDITYEFEIKT